MKTTRLILVGGFLGAGKTTLLWETARKLVENGKRVGLVTNDQAPELVDTAFLSRGTVPVAEVAGSCFCCNFGGLLDAMSQVRKEAEADVIIAEPVGSCTDLSATILQPLKEHMKRELVCSPLSVLADPTRLESILAGGNGGLHPSAAYIFRKQLEESDIIIIGKTDLVDDEPLEDLKANTKAAFPQADIFLISGQTGKGTGEWLEQVMSREDAGRTVTEVDYDVYAEGEAVLGWLNATVLLRGENVDWNTFAQDFLSTLSRHFDTHQQSVGHVKILLSTGEDSLIANLTGDSTTLSRRGEVPPGAEARLTINARVEMTPEALETVVREKLDTAAGDALTTETLAWRCLSPGRPEPTHRYERVVTA